MRKTTLTVLAGAAAMFALAACGNDDTMSDTAMVPGIDTSAGFAVPPTDPALTLPADSLRDTMLVDSLTDTTTTP